MLYAAALRQGDLDWLELRQHDLQRRHVRPSERDLRPGRSRTSSACSRRCATLGLPEVLTRVGGAPSPSRRRDGRSGRLNYHFNFTLIWRNFDKLAWGLRAVSLELAVVCDRHRHRHRPAAVRSPTATGRAGSARVVTAYVEFIRNVPLILLVYLVFYGIPSAGGFSYGPTTSFIIDAVGLCRRLSGRGVPRRARRGAARAARCRQGHRPDAVPAAASMSGCRPCSASSLPALEQHLRLAVQGHLGRQRHRRAGADLRARSGSTSTPSASSRSTRVVTPMYLVTGYAILFLLRLLERRFAVRR